MKKNILLVDDEPYILESLESILKSKYNVIKTSSSISALETIHSKIIDLAILDLNMPVLSGIELLKKIKQYSADTEVIMVTANKDVDSIIESIKLGAYYYVIKPFEVEELLLITEKALEHSSMQNEISYLREEFEKFYDKQIIGESKAMQELFDKIEKIMNKNVTVLIRGSSGTGKELVARAIHFNSIHRNKPFIAINCAAMPKNLIENELFGHEKGAYTGASLTQKGKFEAARDGTLFLDEIGSLDFDLQSKLLRVLQEKNFNRIGGTENIKSTARVISATSVNLEEAIKKGTFREDLYYRLNVFPIELPDLKHRLDDIKLLTKHFINKYRAKYNSPVKELTSKVYDMFYNYDWPGNIRQLENLIERIVLLSKKEKVNITDLPEDIFYNITHGNNDELILKTGLSLDAVEKKYIRLLLKKNNDNITKTSEILDITRKTLRNKLKKYNIKIQRDKD